MTPEPTAAPRLTVLTATFDRASTLPRLFESLVTQTCLDFEWLVIDDGSTDESGRLIEDLALEAPFAIRYIWQENSGKHVALNAGMEHVRTELCAVIDSDDWYMPEALQILLERWDGLPPQRRDEFANVEARCQLPDGTPLGPPLPADVLDCDYYEATILRGIAGDTSGIWRSEVVRSYPFPEDLGPFVSEDLVFNRIAMRYLTRYCSDVVKYCEYQPGGLSDRMTSAERLVESAAARLVHARELLGYRRPMPFRLRLRTHANETRNALHVGEGFIRQWRATPARAGWMATLPLGIALYCRDRLRLRTGKDG